MQKALDFRPGPPAGRRPRDPREGAQAPRDRPPGTHACDLNIPNIKHKKSAELVIFTGCALIPPAPNFIQALMPGGIEAWH